MLKIGVQTRNVVGDDNPLEGFKLLKRLGFSCADFSLNYYLKNTDLYNSEINQFFDKTDAEMEQFFTPHKQAAKEAGIVINQMHMPYPNYVPKAKQEVNDYLRNVVAPKSMKVCSFFECKYIVVHGFKLAYHLGSEAAEWEKTSEFLEFLAPMAREMGITICIENLYNGIGGHMMEGPCCDARKAVERIDRMNDKYGAEVLGFCFDTGHANLVGLDFEDFITTLGHRLKVLHIHDNDGISDLHQMPFTFTKTRDNTPSTDWDGFIRGLKAVKFDKVLSFETAPVLSSFPNELREDALGMIARIGQYFGENIKN
jgi:sugar phosphate isomerase/epimerase